ncbi:hypothetical protein P368_22030 [Comamonas thiooxydans]|nr:hypothetical protein P369_20610 [Comamonas thiooxydans]KGG95219.1 hypothetical protein P367_21245 [Comamonas thiooxydans]KGH00105.1 hypothetical protein P365_21125 [Comamonas thiooxydans]KGH06201.1 hypothetical protein P368_22030 [Comamonas thiooxydans]
MLNFIHQLQCFYAFTAGQIINLKIYRTPKKNLIIKT